MTDINRVVLVGRLTRDPELRALPSGTSVCTLRLAVNDRIRSGGEWQDYANYVDLSVFGSAAGHCAEWLSKGRQVVIDGKLRWREWETQDGSKRSKLEVVAENVQFIGPREEHSSSPGANTSSLDVPEEDFEDCSF